MTRTLVTAIMSTAAVGAARGALDAAIELGLGYGGWRPADAGVPAIYAERMMTAPDLGLAQRINVQDSDGTLIVTFDEELHGPAMFVANACKQQRKTSKHLVLPARGRTRISEAVRTALLGWIDEKRINTLHVAGGGDDELQQAVRDAIVWVLEDDIVPDLRGEVADQAAAAVASAVEPLFVRGEVRFEHPGYDGIALLGAEPPAPLSGVTLAREPRPVEDVIAEMAERIAEGRIFVPRPPSFAELTAMVDASGALTRSMAGQLERSIELAEHEIGSPVEQAEPTDRDGVHARIRSWANYQRPVVARVQLTKNGSRYTTVMKPQAPRRVDDPDRYWGDPPPERSARCAWWVERINAGWRRNRRLREMNYYASAGYFGIYIWEWQHVLYPLLCEVER